MFKEACTKVPYVTFQLYLSHSFLEIICEIFSVSYHTVVMTTRQVAPKIIFRLNKIQFKFVCDPIPIQIICKLHKFAIKNYRLLTLENINDCSEVAKMRIYKSLDTTKCHQTAVANAIKLYV